MGVGMGTPPPQELLEHMEDISMGTGTSQPQGHLENISRGTWAPLLQEHLKHGEDMGTGTPPTQRPLGHTGTANMGVVMGTLPPQGQLEHTAGMAMGTPPPWGAFGAHGDGDKDTPDTLHQEVDDAAGDTKAVGGHTVVGTLVAHMGAGDGDD